MTQCPGCGNYIPIKDEVCYHCRPNYVSTQKPIEVKFTPVNADVTDTLHKSKGLFKNLFRGN